MQALQQHLDGLNAATNGFAGAQAAGGAAHRSGRPVDPMGAGGSNGWSPDGIGKWFGSINTLLQPS